MMAGSSHAGSLDSITDSMSYSAGTAVQVVVFFFFFPTFGSCGLRLNHVYGHRVFPSMLEPCGACGRLLPDHCLYTIHSLYSTLPALKLLGA